MSDNTISVFLQDEGAPHGYSFNNAERLHINVLVDGRELTYELKLTGEGLILDEVTIDPDNVLNEMGAWEYSDHWDWMYFNNHTVESHGHDVGCTLCGTALLYSTEYDEYFCPKCDSWTHTPCGDADCDYCTNRPVKPSLITVAPGTPPFMQTTEEP